MPNSKEIKITDKLKDEDAEAILGRVEPELEDDTDKLELPVNSIPTAWAMRVVYDAIRQTHAKRAMTFARIQGMIDGNPPYERNARTRGGTMANSNVNFRDGETWYESVALAYWSLFNEVQYLAEFTTDIGDPKSNPEYGRIVSEEWDTMMREWPEFYPVMAEHQADFIKFGSSIIAWINENDWRYDSVDVWRFLVPERTRNRTSAMSIAMIEHVYSAQDLIDIVNNASGEEWDKENLKEIIVSKFQLNSKEKKQYSNQAYAEIQRQIRNGDLQGDDRYNDDILVVSAFVREWDGKISRAIIDPSFSGSTNPERDKEDNPGWLYFSDRQYDSMQEALMLFTFTPAEKFLHGNKGLGHRIFNTIEGTTQIENSLMDSCRRSSTILVRTRAGRNKEAKQILFNHGGVTDLGEAEFVQNLMGANLSSSVQTVQYFDQKLQRNNNMSGASMNAPDGKPRTAADAKIQVTKEAKVQKNRISHYYEDLDKLFRETFRKQLKCKSSHPGYEEVKVFKQKCIARGVPEDFFAMPEENLKPNGLPAHLDVKATRASGSGSQVADQIETQTMVSLLPTLGQRGKINVIKDFISANRGFRYIPRYFPPEDQSNEPMADDTLASIENNQLEKGEMVIVSPDNKHAVHAPRHLERMKQIAQSYQEAEGKAREAGSEKPSVDAGEFGHYGLEEVDVAFQTLGPHFVRHLLYLQSDPIYKAQVESMRGEWAILANFGDMIAHNAQEARDKKIRDLQKEQQTMNTMSADERVGMAKVESDARIKLAKLRSDAQLASTRDQLQYLVKRMQVSDETRIKSQKAMAEIAQKAKESEAENTNGRDAEALY